MISPNNSKIPENRLKAIQRAKRTKKNPVPFPLDNDEWKDFEDEREKDYSGLRIQALNLKDKEEELRDQKLQENGQENKKDDGIGPWKVMTPSPIPDVVPAVENVTVKDEPMTTTTTGGRYVPPALRNKGSANNLDPVVVGRRTWKSTAPQIDNESEFPTLGNEVADSKNAFQPVRQGSRDIPSSHNPPLDIGNKFNLLSSSSRKVDCDSD
ncbi:protein CDV3-like protein [Leptotrombidium deliense]|uniref:Protein CDV3-like protein n=1 Tax=Leptotrombidium deliense TaxID=299467 RepID=A0A443SUM0_9ACAR|nr:protein CDV3-like protein [Leptotrombidium deliense]